MLRFANVATPETAAAVAVPESVPPPALGPSVTFTLPAKPVATLPSASWAVTCTTGVIAAPAVALVGCTLKTSALGAPAVTPNAAPGEAPLLASPPPPTPERRARRARRRFVPAAPLARRGEVGGGVPHPVLRGPLRRGRDGRARRDAGRLHREHELVRRGGADDKGSARLCREPRCGRGQRVARPGL